MGKEGCNVNKFIKSFYKNLTLLIFLILPVKVTKVFLELSIAVLITDIRGENCLDNCFNTDKFSALLRTSYDKDILALPTYTLSWFWTEDSLNEKIKIQNGEATIKEILGSNELIKHNLGAVTNTIISRLPYLMKIKLRLNDRRARLSVRHELMSILNQGLQHA